MVILKLYRVVNFYACTKDTTSVSCSAVGADLPGPAVTGPKFIYLGHMHVKLQHLVTYSWTCMRSNVAALLIYYIGICFHVDASIEIRSDFCYI